jgi:MFS transporter, FHS family, L-fucose permease
VPLLLITSLFFLWARRLNLCQSFNSVGAVVTPVIGAAFILTNTESVSVEEASSVKVPYLLIARIFLAVAALIYFTRFPEITPEVAPGDLPPAQPSLRQALQYPHLVRGVLAQFL